MNVRHALATRPSLRVLARWLLAAALFAAPVAVLAGVVVSVDIAPPPLPVYAQPLMPGPGYLWTPGYWRWSDGGYFWVPGTWALAPFTGALWTPGYWGWGGRYYVFHTGYWGPHVGFYGGIHYGFGYTGVGFAGGYWRGGVFNYNRSVTNISNTTNIRNVYDRTVVSNTSNNRTSFNGGAGGIVARPLPAEQLAARDQHTAPTAAQQQHLQAASRDSALRAAVNHGAPAIAATPTPGAFSARGVVRANRAPAQAQAATPRATQARAVSTQSRDTVQTRGANPATGLRSREVAPMHTVAIRPDATPATQLRGARAGRHAAAPHHVAVQARAARRPASRQHPHPLGPPHHYAEPRRNGEHRG